MRKIFKILLGIFAIALKLFALICGVNLIFSYIGEKKRGAMPENGQFYDWKFGRIFYQKRGNGAPVLLIHGFDPAHSSKDFDSLARYLAGKHTVYAIDLLGFGFSDKPWITYTNFLYVQLMHDFIRNVICAPADVIACDGAALTALQAYHFDKSLFGKLILVDPARQENINAAKPFALKFKAVLDFPIFGTFLYNLYSLTGAAPFDKEGRHVFASRLTGHLTSDINKRPDLLTPEVITFGDPAKEAKSFTYNDINQALTE